MEQELYELPEGWEWVHLYEVTKIQSGTGFPKSYQGVTNEEIPFLKVSDMNLPGNESKIRSWNNSISRTTALGIKAKIMPANTVVFPKIGAAIATNKKRMLTTPSAFDNNVMGVQVQERLTPDYLYWYLQGFDLREWASSAALPSMKASTIKEHKIPLPPHDEQKRIVAKLDALFTRIDTAIAHLQETLKLAKDLFASALDEAFSMQNSKWDLVPLSQVATVARGKSKHRPRNDKSLFGGVYPFIQTGNVRNAYKYVTSYSSTYNEKGLAQSKLWHKGTICLTIAANIGDVAMLGMDACFPDSVVGITAESVLNEYVYYFLTTLQKHLDSKANSAAQKNINLRVLSGIEIPLPPAKEQQRIVNHLNLLSKHTRALTTATEEKLIYLTALKASLLDNAFRGQL